MITLLASCSRRKRLRSDAGLRAHDLAPASVDEVSASWNGRVAAAAPVAAAADLYCGRNFLEARRAAAEAAGRLIIASAGLGLIRAADRVPAYELTVTPGSEDYVLARIAPAVRGDAWWDALRRSAPYHTPLAEAVPGDGLIVVALPAAYLRMLEPDLTALPPADRARLRIISTSAEPVVGDALRPLILPYDDRLESLPGGRPGTRSDFVGRAARHFMGVVKAAPEASAEAHAQAVSAALLPYAARLNPVRTRMTDDEILVALRSHWDAAGGRAGRLLRVLRDDLGVACEQTRFKALAGRIREERARA